MGGGERGKVVSGSFEATTTKKRREPFCFPQVPPQEWWNDTLPEFEPVTYF